MDAATLLAIGIVIAGGWLAVLSAVNLRRLHGLSRPKRLLRSLVALTALCIALFYLAAVISKSLNVDPISPACFRSALLVMLSAGLAVEISNTPPRLV